MFSSTDRRNRPSSLTTLMTIAVLVLGVASSTPDRILAQVHVHGADSDTSTVVRLEQATSHLEQMLRTLRDSPSLEETWSSPSVLEAAVTTGRRTTVVARDVRALSATLDSLLRSDAAEQNDALASNLRQIERSTEEMASSLASAAVQISALQQVVHGEGGGAGQGHGHGGGAAGHHAGLHFSHPLFTESVSPDTKIRSDYNVLDLGAQEGTKHEFGLALEYALSRSFSVEAGVPYSASDEALGVTHVSVKFANYALEEQGISLGYGMGLGLPTSGDAAHGDHHHPDEGGHTVRAARAGVMSSPPRARANGGVGVHGTLGRDFYEFEPFFNLGWRSDRWELVGFTTFGIPSGMAEPSEGGSALSWNASTLFQAAPEVQTVLELSGSHGLSGHPVGEDVVNLSPGIKLRPSGGSPLWLGIGGSMPVTNDRSYDGRLQLSFFYHFY